jgi:hypothetical protein
MSDGSEHEMSPITGETEFTDQYGHEEHIVTHADGTSDQYTYDNHGGFNEIHTDPTSGSTESGVTGTGTEYSANMNTSGTVTDGSYADAHGDTGSVALQSDGTYSAHEDMANGEHVDISNMQNPSYGN